MLKDYNCCRNTGATKPVGEVEADRIDPRHCQVAIFTTEALLKIVAMGFVLAPGTYLRDGELAACSW